MDADYLYSSYHYSHPILTERLRAIDWKGDEKVAEKAKDSTGSAAASGREL
jgi:STE24 endopeptidase